MKLTIQQEEQIRELTSYLNRALPFIRNLSSEFHSGAERKSWNQFSIMIEGIEWVIFTLSFLVSSPVAYVQKADHRMMLAQLQDHVQAIAEAVENKDHVLIGDLIAYEFVPLLEEMHLGLTELKIVEVGSDDANE